MVIKQYQKLVNSLPRRDAKLLTLVVPDHPTNPEVCRSIVRENSEMLRWLAKRCDLVLPIHKVPNGRIDEHAMEMMKELRYCNVRLGVPCKAQLKTDKKSYDLRLSLKEIETLLSLKVANRALFKSVHYLALSEKSKGALYKERLGLARVYGVNMSCDCCRTTALFGSESSNRLGNVTARALLPDLIDKAIERDAEFIDYGPTQEWNDPALHDMAIEMINSDALSFVMLWNECQSSYWHVNEGRFNDKHELEQYMTELIYDYPVIIEDELTQVLKRMFIRWFEKESHSPTPTELRAQTLANIFTQGDSDLRTPVQGSLF